ncbi:GNAT family N-acetyltransferase [candidate division TA06 bacterium]|uniref:GNAT family N-acetyltransferase n=1 Tax=candidate division TA06 bacterium TaxID=2250710 RepID=A0A523UUX0_UNCT6|nr:MAG: GNAT family N-acetyltransferase [candidate division TA06 bacterium]
MFELQSYGEIIDVAVKSTHRRKGIGTKMVSRIYEWFKSRGVNRIELRVAEGNEISGFPVDCNHHVFQISQWADRENALNDQRDGKDERMY